MSSQRGNPIPVVCKDWMNLCSEQEIFKRATELQLSRYLSRRSVTQHVRLLREIIFKAGSIVTIIPQDRIKYIVAWMKSSPRSPVSAVSNVLDFMADGISDNEKEELWVGFAFSLQEYWMDRFLRHLTVEGLAKNLVHLVKRDTPTARALGHYNWVASVRFLQSELSLLDLCSLVVPHVENEPDFKLFLRLLPVIARTNVLIRWMCSLDATLVEHQNRVFNTLGPNVFCLAEYFKDILFAYVNYPFEYRNLKEDCVKAALTVFASSLHLDVKNKIYNLLVGRQSIYKVSYRFQREANKVLYGHD